MKTAGILLCAGFGSRLAPLSEFIPKPAIPFCGVAMAKYARRALELAGVEQLGMNVHHLPDEMIHAMDDGKWLNGTRDIVISREGEEILGTGGGAARVAKMMPDCDRFIIYHGDVLCAADLKEALDCHERSGAKVTLVILKRPKAINENVRKSLGMIGVANHEVIQIRDWHKKNTEVRQAENGARVAFISETGEALYDFEPRCFAGIHIVERSVLEAIDESQNVCLVTQIYRDMLARGERINAYQPDHEVFFADVGTPATYLDAQSRCLIASRGGNDQFGALKLFDAGQSVTACGDAAQQTLADARLFGQVRVPDGVEFGQNVCVCEGAIIGEGEKLENEMRCADGGIEIDKTYVLYRIPESGRCLRVELEK